MTWWKRPGPSISTPTRPSPARPSPGSDRAMLRYLTAGESHGPALTAIVEGFPSGVALDAEFINHELKRRQGGYGRGKRQTLETDRVIVDSGTFHGVTTGAPLTLRLINNDAKLERLSEPAAPRGGHIDLAGSMN